MHGQAGASGEGGQRGASKLHQARLEGGLAVLNAPGGVGKAGLAWQQDVPVLCCAAVPLDDSELHLLLGKIVSTLGGVAAIELIVGLQLFLHLMEGGGGGGVHKA